jgi:uracil-DNA glycosylase
MKSIGYFPFGQEVQTLQQRDQTPKQIFVLGVYASAVHARWIGADGKNLVNALAVASEPYIFWRGDQPDRILNEIRVPATVGKLETADAKFNGPSGLTLDAMFLEPIGVTRDKVWLCDLIPHSCSNTSQKNAIQRAYTPLIKRYQLPEPSVPDLPRVFTNDIRRSEIADELTRSKAEVLILLGDQPIKWFLSYFDNKWIKLSDFGQTSETYGSLHKIKAFGKELLILPLAHPRQAGKLGASSEMWSQLHQTWQQKKANKIKGAL